MQPIIGIKLKNKNFVSLLNVKGEYSKAVFVYKDDFFDNEIPVYTCKVNLEKKVEKIYKIGSITLNQIYFANLKLNSNDFDDKKSVVKIVSSLADDGVLTINVFIGVVTNLRPVKIYEVNILEEMSKQEIQEKEISLLHYGDFVKLNSKNAFLLPEEDLTLNGKTLLTEKNVDKKISEQKNQNSEDAIEEDKYYELADSAKKTKYTIGGKLVVIITLILLVSVGLASLFSSYYVSEDVLKNAEMNNFTTNEQVHKSVAKKIQTTIDNVLMFSNLYLTSKNDSQIQNSIENIFFEKNKDVIAIVLPNQKSIYNNDFFNSKGIAKTNVSEVITFNNRILQKANSGKAQIINVSEKFNLKTSAIFLPVAVQEKNENKFETIVIIFATDSFEELFGTESMYSNFIVDKDGHLIAGLDSEKVLKNQYMTGYKIVKEFVNSNSNNSQVRFVYNKSDYYGAFKNVASVNCAVITIIPTEIVLEPVIATVKRNAYLALAVVSISIIIIWFFAKSISNPIKALSAASIKIKEGDFEIKIKPHSQDELGLLTTNFVSMSHGLAERERLKDTFGKFTNKKIAEQAMKGELALGGENKFVTIFFSDIRSFTAMSEQLSAIQVVEFLNEYMAKMVKCVTETGGFIDKYIGDAIMATWGAPISAGTPREDALNSIRCALKMRAELIAFNKVRVQKGLPIIKIGCGLNSGSVVAGQMGSEERMEYTCIGDTVNVASRTESLNKPFQTDILITENTYQLVKDCVVVEKMVPVKVKGKTAPLNMYAVINMPEENEILGAGVLGFKTIDQVREACGFAKPELDGVDLDEEEKKFEIQN